MSEAVLETPAPVKSKFQMKYDMEDRTLTFAHDVRTFVRRLPRHMLFNEDVMQLVRASGNMGAQYIEANEAKGRKDFLNCIRAGIKEAKEAHFWLNLIDVGSSEKLKAEKERLCEEAFTFVRIFCSILGKVGTKKKPETK